MARKMTREQAEAILAMDGPTGIDVFKSLPNDVDPELAATAALKIGLGSWGFCRTSMKLPPTVIRAILRRGPDPAHSGSVFVHGFMDGDHDDLDLIAAWGRAMQACLDLNTSYGWGSKQRRAKLQGVADDAALVAAIQTTAARCEQVPLDMLAVLAIDATEISTDAFVPHFHRANESGDDGLNRLQVLRKYSRPGTAIDELLTVVDKSVDERSSVSPALALAAHIGVGKPRVLWFQLFVHSAAPMASQVQAHVFVDSRKASWYGVSVTKVETDGRYPGTSFDDTEMHRDDLDLGTCSPQELPTYFATVAQRLGVQWDAEGVGVSSNLRGKKRAALIQWLLHDK
jgi:hypothetical protein